jgi:predicted ATPase
MKLSRLSVKHYKSLANITIDLNSGITVLAGQNAAGKSNFVDSLRFLRNASLHGLDHAVRIHHGIARIRQLSATRPYAVTFDLQIDQNIAPSSSTFTQLSQYNLEIGSKGGSFHINKESAHYYAEPRNPNKKNLPDEATFAKFSRTRKGEIEIETPNLTSNDNQSTLLDLGDMPPHGIVDSNQMALGSRLLIGGGRTQFLGHEIRRYMSRWKFSALYPNTLRNLDIPSTDTDLADDGANWASIINIASKGKFGMAMLENIYDMMRVVLPDFREVVIEPAGSYLIPQFKFGSGKTARQFDPVQLSDGTLRIFGILLSLYQRPSPQLLVIEEPEQTVHPGASTMLAEAFKEAAKTTQIIVTTHSPQFIDHFDPEDIRVVSMDDGVTKISRIKESQRISVDQNLMGLGEFMAAEGILPE